MTPTNKNLFNSATQKPFHETLRSQYLPYWYWFVICVFLAFSIAVFHARYTIAPQYLISGTLLIKDKNSTGNLSLQMTGMTGNKDLGNEMVILQSKNLMQRVISELALHTSYYF